MDLFEDLNLLTSSCQIIKKSAKLAKSSQKTFLLVTFFLILPLSLLQLWFEDNSVVGLVVVYPNKFPSFKQIADTYSLYKLLSLVLFYTSYVLSASFITFTVASIYITQRISLSSVIFAVPRIYIKILFTSFYLLPFKMANDATSYLVSNAIDNHIGFDTTEESVISIVAEISFNSLFFVVYAYITALWHLAFVVSVLEPGVWGFSAITKSKQLLRQKFCAAYGLEILYLVAVWIVESIVYEYVLFHDYGLHILIKVLLVLVCVILLVLVNFIGLLSQNVFYYACKSHHNEVIDKQALHNHLERKKILEDNGGAGGNSQV
ncbi:hypothetical protein MKX03_005463 [Papaver bracteatum]|nr:hypothetical protein MKX03_005463 [Papaver bracteatum]